MDHVMAIIRSTPGIKLSNDDQKRGSRFVNQRIRRTLVMIKNISYAATIATTIVVASPASALRNCSIWVADTNSGPWERVIKADRGETFGKRVINKWDDGDTCRSQGRLIGPDICADLGRNWFQIRGLRNNGNPLDWEPTRC